MTAAIVGAVFVRDHRVLLVHRHPQRRWYPDCWDVVGGHVEAGESSQDALLRECREELGVEVLAFRGVDLGGSLPGIAMTTFLVTDWRGELANTEPEEHDDLRWFTADQISGLRLADPRIRTALHTLARDAPAAADSRTRTDPC